MWCLRNKHRNSILLQRQNLDLGTASDWLKICFNQSETFEKLETCTWKTLLMKVFIIISFWCEIEQAHSTIIFIQNEIRKMVNVESFWQSWSWFSIPMLQNFSSSQPWSTLSKLPFSTNRDQENNYLTLSQNSFFAPGFDV